MTDLTTVADVKSYAKITTTDNDVLLGKMITGASALILNTINRSPILSATVVDIYDGSGRDWMLLRQYPVTAVAKVEYDGAPADLAAADTSVWPPKKGWALDPPGDANSQQRLVLYGGACFPSTRAAVRVTYTAGYATTPADLAQACIEMVAEDYARKSRLGIVSQAVGGQETVSYSQKDMSDRVKLSLKNFKRVTPV